MQAITCRLVGQTYWQSVLISLFRPALLCAPSTLALCGRSSRIQRKKLIRCRQPAAHETRRSDRPGRAEGELQVLFYRGLSDRHVNQSSILKPRDELIVFDRIEGDATGAPPEHAVIFGAKSGGGVPVRVDDPFEWGSVADVTVVRGEAIENYNDHISLSVSAVPAH